MRKSKTHKSCSQISFCETLQAQVKFSTYSAWIFWWSLADVGKGMSIDGFVKETNSSIVEAPDLQPPADYKICIAIDCLSVDEKFLYCWFYWELL